MVRRCFPGGIALILVLMSLMFVGIFLSCDKSSAPTQPQYQSSSTVPPRVLTSIGGAALATDKNDYLPGETVTLTGTGFAAGEAVTMAVAHADGSTPEGEGHAPWEVAADENGGFVTTWTVCGDDCFGSTMLASASGQSSGNYAEAIFTDGLGTGRVSSVVPTDGGCVHQTVNNPSSVESWDVQEGKSYHVTLTNITECSDETIGVLVKSSATGNQCLVATRTGEGTYEFDVTLPAQACNTMPIEYCVSNCKPSSGYLARRSDGNDKQSHLRMYNFGAGCDWASGSEDTDCNGGGGCEISLECPPDVAVTCASEVPAGDPSAPVITMVGDCEPVTVTWVDNVTSQTCANQYTLARTYTATASNGATASCTQTITVFDDLPPTVVCPADISVQLLPGDACLPVVTYDVTASDNCDGVVTVTATPPSGSEFPIGTTVVTVVAMDACGNSAACNFTVTVSTSACGVKFYDANVNGLNDDGIFVPNWQIDLSGAASATAYTDASGHFCFTGLGAGNYTVSENPTGTWIATTATSYSFELGCPVSIEFGNVCLGAGGGKTLGFWSNQNGQAKMNDGGTMAPELAMLSSLCLVDANGNPFDPAAYPQFRTWLLSATAVNMSYMLSAQLAAMELNVEAGLVSAGSLVYAPGCGNTGIGNNFISIADLLSAAGTALCADGYTPDGDPNRAEQECLKNALDRANNNLNFVQSQPCGSTAAKSSTAKLQ